MARNELSERADGVRRGLWKTTVDVTLDEEPFALPMGWAWARINDTGFYINGLPFKPSDWRQSGTPIIRIQNLSDSSKAFNYAQGNFPEDVIVQRGDLLVSWSATLEAFVWDGDDGVLNQHIFRVQPCETVVAKPFLFYLLRQGIRDMADSEHAHGLVMAHINRGPFLAHIVAIPPLAEQHRIVARVDELMGLLDLLEAARSARDEVRRAALDAALAALRDAKDTKGESAWARIADQIDALISTPEDVAHLRQTILQLAVSGRLGQTSPIVDCDGPFPLPVDWVWENLASITDVITSGSRSWNQYYASSGATFIRSQDIKLDRLTFENRIYVDVQGGVEGTRTRVSRGDLLVTITGANVGKCAHLVDDPGDAYVSQHVALLRLSTQAFGRFVHLWLIAEFGGRGILLKDSYGAKPGLNLNQLRSLPVPVPPLTEQCRIVTEVDALMALCDALEARLTSARDFQTQFAAAAVHHLDV